jgi:hypothetical protein
MSETKKKASKRFQKSVLAFDARALQTHHASNQVPSLDITPLDSSFIKDAAIWRAVVIEQCSPGEKCQCSRLLVRILQGLRSICLRVEAEK